MARNRSLALLLLVTILSFVFLPVLGHDFVAFDDDIYVTGNRMVRGGLSLAAVGWSFTTLHAANWHPLTWLSHLLDVSLFGLRPGGHHATSLLLHLAATLALFAALESLTGALWRSFLVAALFGVHPLHVESVAWIAERKDVLSACLGFAAVGAYAAYVRRPGRGRYALVTLFFALGLLAKPMLVTLPMLLLLLDHWPLGRWGTVPSRRLLLEKVPLLVLAAVSGVVTLIAQWHGGTVAGRELFPLAVRLQNAAVSAASYLVKAVFPARLALYYPHPGNLLPGWKVAASLLLLGALTAAAARVRKSRPHLLSGWLWFLVGLLPVIGLVQVGAQAMADRYTYIPLVGPFVALAWSCPRPGVRGGRALIAAAAALLLVLGGFAAARVRFWRDTATLFERELAINPSSWWAYNNLGNLATQEGRHGAAETLYRRALAIRPDYAQAHQNLALALGAQGRLAEALPEYQEALRLDPGFTPARNNLGSALALLGDTAAAEREYRLAIRLAPDEVAARVNLAHLLLGRGATAGAEALYREATRIDPGSVEAWYNLGSLLASRRDYGGAEAALREALRLDPGSATAHNNLGATLVALGKPHEAASHFREAARLDPDSASARENLERYRARYSAQEQEGRR